MLPVSIGLDTTRLTTAQHNSKTDCLTVALPLPSLHACRNQRLAGARQVPSYRGGGDLLLLFPPALVLALQHVVLRHCALCQGVGTMAQVSIISSPVLASSRHCSPTPC